MKLLLCLLAALFVASAIAEPIRQETNPLDVPAADSNQDDTKLVLDDKSEEKDDNEISDEEQELDDLPEDAEEEAEQDDLPESDAEEEAEQDELPESGSDAEEEDDNKQDELPESDDEPKADLSELASAEDSNDPDANEEDPRLHRPRCYNVLRSCGRRQCKAISRPKCSRHCNRRPLGPCRSVKKNCKAPRRLKNGITIATCRVEKTCRYALRNTCYRRCIQPFTCTTCHRRHRICRCRPGYFRRGRFCIRRRCRPGYFRRRGFCVRRCHRPGSRYWNGRRCVSCRNRRLYRSYHGICIRRCRPGYFRRGRFCIRRRG